MKKILVPIDFSDHSAYALEVAASLAHDNSSEIVVLHMMGLSQATLTTEESGAAEAIYYMKLVKKRFSEFLDRDYLKGIKVSQTVQNYKKFSEINNVAQEQDADLIVMGSHGVSGLSEPFVGSNTEKVVRTSDIPVLVIKERIKGFNIREVVFACDFKIENIRAYLNAMNLFKELGANIHLVYVNLPNEHFKSTTALDVLVEDFLYVSDKGDMANLDKVIYQCDYTVEDGIYNYSKKIGADLIAIPTHGRRGLSHFFMGSKAEDIANHATYPVMTFRI